MTGRMSVQIESDPSAVGPVIEATPRPSRAGQVPLTLTGGLMPVPCWGFVTETVGFAALTDGLSTSGTYTMTSSIPAGALLYRSKVLVPTGFTGDTTAVITLGDGTDPDRYNTGTPSVFTTAATGIEVGLPSGALLQIAAVAPVITITSGSDWGLVVAGSVTVSIYYLVTV